MKAEEAWERVKGELCLDAKRSDYDTWIRDTVGIGLADHTLVVEVANGYARDWLSSNVASRAQSVISEILGGDFVVQFISADEGIEERGLSDQGDTFSDNAHEDAIKLQTEYLSLYDEIVRPERVIVTPRYYLRWIPWLGVDLAWLPVGFRQAAFLHGSAFDAGATFEASAKQIAHWSGMSLSTFWRRINDPILRWFVEAVGYDKASWKLGKDERPHRPPRKWKVVMSMPLTPADQDSLRAWLRERLNKGMDPLSTLQLALEMPLDELVPWPEEVIFGELAGEPRSVQQVVREALGEFGASPSPAIEELSAKLQEKILNGVILVRHYFVEKWLPRLGPGPGWLITLLRSECYYNPKTGELRDDVWITGGRLQLIRSLGIRRTRTVAEWLRDRGQTDENCRPSAEISRFIEEVDRYKGPTQTVALRMKLEMGEPLTPEDQEIQDRRMGAGRGGEAGVHKCRGGDANETHSSGGSDAVDTIRKRGNDAHDTIRKGGSDAHGTIREGGSDANDTIRSGGYAREWHGIKDSLNIRLSPGKDFNLNTTTCRKIEQKDDAWQGKKVVVDSWDLGKLLHHNRVNRSVVRDLTARGSEARAFISWLLYGASEKGGSIKNPVAYALSRLMKEPQRGAGATFDQLAAMAPHELARMIVDELEGTAKWNGNGDWKRVMAGSSRRRLLDLAEQLGVDEGDGL